MKPKLVATNSVHYPESKKKSTVCIKINAYCSYCKQNGLKECKYVIAIKDCAFKTKEDAVKVSVEHPEHSYSFNFTAATTEETTPDSGSLQSSLFG